MNRNMLILLGIVGLGLYLANKGGGTSTRYYEKFIGTNTALSPTSLPPATGLPMLYQPTPIDMASIGDNYKG